MTKNQIEYAKHREDARHNRVTEQQKLRDQAIGLISANAAKSQADTAVLRQAEDARHNQQTEAINWWTNRSSLEETSRHNRMQENAAARTASIQERQATTAERQAAVSERSAAVSERQASVAERQAAVSEAQLGINRYDAQSRRISANAGSASAAAALQQADVAGLNAITRQNELAASVAYNNATISELQRSHIANEDIARSQAFASLQQAAVSRTNAITKQGELSVKQGQLAIQQDRLKIDRFNANTQRGAAIVSGFNQTANTVINAVKTYRGK